MFKDLLEILLFCTVQLWNVVTATGQRHCVVWTWSIVQSVDAAAWKRTILAGLHTTWLVGFQIDYVVALVVVARLPGRAGLPVVSNIKENTNVGIHTNASQAKTRAVALAPGNASKKYLNTSC